MRLHVFLNFVRKDLMSLEDSKQFGKDVKNILENFERFQDYDFEYWLTNAIGTPFEFDGFAQKPYYIESLKNELLNIYDGT